MLLIDREALNGKKRSKKAKSHFCLFSFHKQSLRVRKPRLSVSALNLPQTCGFRGKSEFARHFYSNNAQKEAKRRFCLFSHMSIRMEVNAARIKKGVPRKARRRGEKPPPARRSRAHGRFPPSSRKILLSAQKNFRELKNNTRASKIVLLPFFSFINNLCASESRVFR